MKYNQYLTDVLIEFDEMSFIPGTTCPNPDKYAREYKQKLIKAIDKQLKERRVKIIKEENKKAFYYRQRRILNVRGGVPPQNVSPNPNHYQKLKNK